MSSYQYEKQKNDSYVYDTDELAGLGERLVAMIIDGIILGIIGGILFSGTREGMASGIVTFLVGVTYNWYFLTQQNGQTIGKRVMGIRVVKTNNRPLETADVIVRYVGYYINSFIFGLGWIWAAFDSRKQGWHDKLAATLVVKA